jgi:hypothetical protein
MSRPRRGRAVNILFCIPASVAKVVEGLQEFEANLAASAV